jgi:hypothetical protein
MAMVLRIFDPLTGKHIEITVPDSSPSRIPAVPAPKPLAGFDKEPRPGRSPARPFDPYFGNLAESTAHAWSEFDEIMWSAA